MAKCPRCGQDGEPVREAKNGLIVVCCHLCVGIPLGKIQRTAQKPKTEISKEGEVKRVFE